MHLFEGLVATTSGTIPKRLGHRGAPYNCVAAIHCVVHDLLRGTWRNSSRILACTSVISGDLARRVAGRLPGAGETVRYTRLVNQPQPQPGQRPSSPFVRACRREPVPAHPGLVHAPGGPVAARVPGRVREGFAMMEACTTAELITEITLQPLRRYDVDAAILFSDIVVPLRAVGVDVDIKPGVGPVVERPFRADGRRRAAARPGARRRALHHRGGQVAGRRARRQAAHRVRGRAVHARRPT